MKTIIFLMSLLLANIGAFAAETQSVSALQDAINGFVSSQLDPAGEYQITTAQIDPRLQLPACDQPLDIFPQSGAIKTGRNTLGIRCTGSNNWTIYSSVVVRSFEAVLVLTKPLARHEVIGPDYLTLETRDTSTLQQGYLSDAKEILGKQATRFIPSGSVLYKMHYSEPTLVKRGERVSIQSGKPGLVITSTGVAMMDGTRGQQISVKNASSQRVIQATVVNPGLVNVFF